MMLAFIIVVCVVYYILGWIMWYKVAKKYEYSLYTTIDIWCFITALIALGIFPISIVIYWHVKDKYENRMKVEINTVRYNSHTSYGLYVDSNQRMCFGFPDNLYYGTIDKDIRKMDKKELDKAMDMINDWGFKEKEKLARLNAITEIYKQKE